ncbi:MAG: amidohydrolase family protein [Caldilineaceae bacterium]
MPPTLIRAGTVITADANDRVLHNQGILLEDDVIVAVDDWAQFGEQHAAPVTDLSGYTVMPGLIDAHTHVVHDGDPNEDWRLVTLTRLPATSALKAARNARRQVENGITTIRDLGANDWVDIALRDAINEGWQLGPRIVACGHGITGPGGHMDARRYARPGTPLEMLSSIGVVVESADEARRATWEQLMRGADVIKLNATLSEYVRALGGQCSPELTFDMMQAICEVAHNAGRKVAAHCHGGPGVQDAIRAGVDTFEHGRFLTDELLDQIAEGGRFLVPTLSPEAQSIANDAPPKDAATRKWYVLATGAMYKTVERAHKRGVRVVAGTDAGMPYVYHGSLSFEMKHLAQAGLPNKAVIASATRVAAEALGLEDTIGQIAPNFCADLIVLNGDPTQNLSVLEQPAAPLIVMQRGEITVDRREPGTGD